MAKRMTYKQRTKNDKKKKDRIKKIDQTQKEIKLNKVLKRKAISGKFKQNDAKKEGIMKKQKHEMKLFTKEMEAFRNKGLEDNITGLEELVAGLDEDSIRRAAYENFLVALKKLVDPNWINEIDLKDCTKYYIDGNLENELNLEAIKTDFKMVLDGCADKKCTIGSPILILQEMNEVGVIDYVNYPTFLAKASKLIVNLFGEILTNDANPYLLQKLIILLMVRDISMLRSVDVVEGTSLVSVADENELEINKIKLEGEEVDKKMEETMKELEE